jgi:hypothetical protein
MIGPAKLDARGITIFAVDPDDFVEKRSFIGETAGC